MEIEDDKVSFWTTQQFQAEMESEFSEEKAASTKPVYKMPKSIVSRCLSPVTHDDIWNTINHGFDETVWVYLESKYSTRYNLRLNYRDGKTGAVPDAAFVDTLTGKRLLAMEVKKLSEMKLTAKQIKNRDNQVRNFRFFKTKTICDKSCPISDQKYEFSQSFKSVALPGVLSPHIVLGLLDYENILFSSVYRQFFYPLILNLQVRGPKYILF